MNSTVWNPLLTDFIVWNPVNMIKLARKVKRGTIVRRLMLDEDKVVDGDPTGYFCGVCQVSVEWDHFHVISRKGFK